MNFFIGMVLIILFYVVFNALSFCLGLSLFEYFQERERLSRLKKEERVKK